MPNRNSDVETLIHDYLSAESMLKEKLSTPNIDFGFTFSFPPGAKGQNMSVFKPKNRNFINIVIKVKLSKTYIDAINKLKENMQLEIFTNIRKYFINKEVYFRIDKKSYIIEIIEQQFFDKDEYIPINDFFKSIQKIYYCYLFSNLLLDDYCSGKEPSLKKHSNFDYSLYS